MLFMLRRDALDAELGEDGGEQGDHLGVDRRIGGADGLGADLVVLAVAPGLRLLVAEHRAVVPELHRLRPLVHAVLDVGAADRRRALGAQRQRSFALVEERVHLLAHDVRGLADAALEEARLLELGRDDVAVAVRREEARRGGHDGVAARGLLRQQVVGALGRLRCAHQRCSGS